MLTYFFLSTSQTVLLASATSPICSPPLIRSVLDRCTTEKFSHVSHSAPPNYPSLQRSNSHAYSARFLHTFHPISHSYHQISTQPISKVWCLRGEQADSTFIRLPTTKNSVTPHISTLHHLQDISKHATSIIYSLNTYIISIILSRIFPWRRLDYIFGLRNQTRVLSPALSFRKD